MIYAGYNTKGRGLSFVMPGLVPGIHAFKRSQIKTWMAGTSPAMTMTRVIDHDLWYDELDGRRG
jgi:hypothetical protein